MSSDMFSADKISDGFCEGISPSEDLKSHTVKVFPGRMVLSIETWDLRSY